MTINALKWTGSREFKAEPTGEYRTSRNGKRVPVTRGEEYVNTIGAGRMKLKTWYRAMEDAVAAEGKMELLEKIIDHCRRLAWLKSEEQVRHEALECLSHESYKVWWGINHEIHD